MKQKKLTITIVAFIALIMSSCVTTNRGFQSSPVISRNVELDPIKADIKVDTENKLKGESSSTYFLFFRISGDNTFADGITYSTDASASIIQKLNPLKLAQMGRLNRVRSAAAYKALINGEYDVLVHPNYITEVENYLIIKKYRVTVEGYGGKYENFRTEKQKIVIFQDGKEVIVED